MTNSKTRMTTDIRQEQIIETAMKIINNSGFLSLTTRALADEIGVSEPALYRHFINKDEIILGIIRKMEYLWTEVEKELNQQEDPLKKLLLFIEMHFDYINQNPNIIAVLFADEYIRWNSLVGNYLQEIQSKRYEYLEQLLDEGCRKLSFKKLNTGITAMIILGTIRSTILSWRNANYQFSLPEYSGQVLHTISLMITKDNQ